MQIAGRMAESSEWFRQAQAAAIEVKNSFLSTMTNVNLAENFIWQGDFSKGRALLESAIERIRELGEEGMLPGVIMDLGWADVRAGNLAQARKHLADSLVRHRQQGVTPLIPVAMFALLEAKKGNRETALEWMGLVRAQPTLQPAAADFFVRPDWSEMTAGLSPAEVDAALARGASLSLPELLKQLESQGQEVGTAGT
jgi:ATP/maltotriose-dependent transcriptional regulator MalT